MLLLFQETVCIMSVYKRTCHVGKIDHRGCLNRIRL